MKKSRRIESADIKEGLSSLAEKDINSCICPLGKLDHFREQKYLRPVPIQVIQIG